MGVCADVVRFQNDELDICEKIFQLTVNVTTIVDWIFPDRFASSIISRRRL